MILIGALVAFAGAVVFAALLGTGAPSAGADSACSNEAIRQAQNATQVGECRAFERVSPADKGGGDIFAEQSSSVAAAGGDAAAFESKIGFADSEGSGAQGRIAYLSNRGADGWATHATTPRSNVEASIIALTGTSLLVYSDDLSHAITFGYDLPGANDDTPRRVNLYVEDTATRALQTVTSSQTGEGDPIQYPPFDSILYPPELAFGSAPDLRHTSFMSGGQMVPAIPGEYPNGSENAYTWDEGTIHLAGILPDGTIPPGGSRIEPRNYLGSMSADGSRLAFTASAGGWKQVYLRIDHSHTDLVSESENPAFTEEAGNVYFEGMTPDGRNLFFATDSPLLPEDTAPGLDLYRWTYGPDPEIESDNLTLITNTGALRIERDEGRGSLIGMSDDGRHVYVNEFNDGHVAVWNDGVTTTLGVSLAGSGWKSVSLGASSPGYARVSPDGNWFTYIAEDQLYLYDRVANNLTCASCPGPLAENGFPVFWPEITKTGNGIALPTFRPRYLTPDGKVFFSTAAPLLPADTNGVADVYSYDGPTGAVSLITSGRGSYAAEMTDASEGGDNVFFVTRAQLVPSDHDEYADLYDARVGGGFDEPDASPVAPCSGEACQGGSVAPPGGPAIASGAATRGNVKEERRPPCGKRQRRVKRHGKVRCVKRKQHPKQQSAHRGGLR